MIDPPRYGEGDQPQAGGGGSPPVQRLAESPLHPSLRERSPSPFRGGSLRLVLRLLLAAAFLYAGFVHVTRPDFFLPIVPDWVPVPRLTVIATGWCEIAGAAGLMIPRLRRLAGVMLALYAVCVFPANIKHALEHVRVGNGTLGWWYHGPRLLFQPVIVWWCLYAGGVIDWPFPRGRDRAGSAPQAPPPPQ